MFRFDFTKYQNIIQICRDKIIQILSQKVVDIALKREQSVA